MKSTTRTKVSTPADYGWVHEQNPELSLLPWWKVAAQAGCIVAEDILSRIRLAIHDSADDDTLHVVVHIDGYTEREGEDISFPLTELVFDACADPVALSKKLSEYVNALPSELTEQPPLTHQGE